MTRTEFWRSGIRFTSPDLADITRQNRPAILVTGALIILNALLFFVSRGQTYVHIDAIAHVNKARGLFDSYTPGLKQLGSIWLPLQHLLIAPLTWFDILWSTGLAGSLVSAACFVLTGWFLFGTAYRITEARAAGWLAFFFFALNPRLIYLFTTPMTEPLMIACAAGLLYFLVCWLQTNRWQPLAWAALMAFFGTLTRYEGWAIAAASIVLVFVLAAERRIVTTILYTGAVVTGPLLWMIYNMVCFEDPLMFTYGRGSAKDYALEYFFKTGKTFATAGSWPESIYAYISDVAYCINPTVFWLSIGGVLLTWFVIGRQARKLNMTLFVLAAVPFAFYVYNLYSNTVPILMPGLVSDEPGSIYNVRYGAIMAATLPVYAALLLHFIFNAAQHRRRFAFLFLTPLLLPDPIPRASQETGTKQFTQNLLYTEGVHNQSFWMPPFVEIADRLKAAMDETPNGSGYVLTNSKILHVVVWRTAIPMRRFIHEMNKERWDQNLTSIDPGIGWVVTEEGDQLWNAQGRFLQQHFIEVAAGKAESTRVVHLYRRP